MYFSNKIAYFQQSVKNQEEAFDILASQLLEVDCVTEDYLQNIIKREEAFSTGLLVNGVGIAIPHTDSQYVKTSQIAFLSTDEPIDFFEMGTNDKVVKVRLIFMLALKKADEQLETLQKLVEMIQKEEILQKLLTCTNQNEFFEIVHGEGIK